MAFIFKVERNNTPPAFFRFGGNTCRVGITQSGFLTVTLADKWLGVFTAISANSNGESGFKDLASNSQDNKDLMTHETAATEAVITPLDITRSAVTPSPLREYKLCSKDTLYDFAPSFDAPSFDAPSFDAQTAFNNRFGDRYSINDYNKVFFTAELDRIILESADDHKINNNKDSSPRKTILVGDQITLPRYSFLTVMDLCILPTFIPDTIVSAAAALIFDEDKTDLSNKYLDFSNLPHIFISLIGNSHSYPLIPDITYSVGATDEDLLYIDLPSAGKKLFTITFNRTEKFSGLITIIPRKDTFIRSKGLITGDSITVPFITNSQINSSKDFVFDKDSYRFELLPAGITFEIIS